MTEVIVCCDLSHTGGNGRKRGNCGESRGPRLSISRVYFSPCLEYNGRARLFRSKPPRQRRQDTTMTIFPQKLHPGPKTRMAAFLSELP